MRKFKSHIFLKLSIVAVGFLVAGITLAQYDYYDPYSNSNIDYFPSNPVYTKPSKTDSSTTGGSKSGSTSGGTTSGGTTNSGSPVTPSQTPSAVVPENATAVTLNPVTGEVFNAKTGALITDARYHKASRQILYRNTWRIFGKVLTDTTGYVDIDPRGSAVTSPNTSSLTQPLSTAQDAESTVVPENATAVTLNPVTGEVFNAKTGALITDARYDKVARKIYYKNTDSTFGKVLTDTTGYVNIDTRGLANSPISPTVQVDYADSGGSSDATLKKTPTPTPTGLTGSDSGPGEPEEQIAEDRDLEPLDIDFGGEELRKFRVEISTVDTIKKVTVRGWDPEKKDEIVGRPEDVKTHKDLKTYIEAVALSDEAIQGISIDEGALEVISREKGKLFWFIPVELSGKVVIKLDIKDSSKDIASVRFPWWHVFVKKNFSPSTLEKDLRAGFSDELNPAKWEKVGNSNMPTNAGRIARILGFVSNIMKTKHDTVKNSKSE